MYLFEKNTGKKIKKISVIFFIGAIIYCLIYRYQGIYTIAEVGHLIQQGYTATPISMYVQSLILGLIPRAAFVLLAFPLYGFGKIVEAHEPSLTTPDRVTLSESFSDIEYKENDLDYENTEDNEEYI